MEIRNESSADKPNIVDLVVLVKNETSSKFNGNIYIDVPKGFRSVSGNQIKVELNVGEKDFYP
jgi:YbbR domain-containing protein